MSDPVAFDCETYPIYQVGKATSDTVPRLVCLSWADDSNPEGTLLDRKDAVAWFVEQLEEGRTLVGANLPFDLLVMVRACAEEGHDVLPQVFDIPKYDVQVAARLEDIGRGGLFTHGGGYTLAQLEKRLLPQDVRTTEKKGINVWRLRYNELEGVPVEDYPADAARYALEDAVNTWGVYLAQNRGNIRNGQGVGIRSQYDFELSLMSAWGIMIDEAHVGMLVEFYDAQKQEALSFLQTFGLFREDGTKDMKAVRSMFEEAFWSIGESPPRTDSGKYVSTNKSAMNALEDAGAMTPAFEAYSKYNRADKFLSTYLRPLADVGSGPLCPRFNVLVDSGRTSSSGPNVQNFPARTNAHDKQILAEMLEDEEEIEDERRMLRGIITGPDIRGSLVPRPGCVFVAADYSAIEMAGVAQNYRNIFGELGTLGQAINAKLKLHDYVAAELLQKPYEWVVDEVANGNPEVKAMRQVSKIANYGFWGGATSKTFVSFARQQGEIIDPYTAERAKLATANAWSEMDPYFRFIAQQQQVNGSFYIEQHGPDRRTKGWRLRVCRKFTQAANTLFQGIVADGALWSLHLIQRECYIDEESPLFGARPILFVHDEFVLEVSAERAEAAGQRLSELMVEGMKRFLVDLDVEATPEIMEQRWSK